MEFVRRRPVASLTLGAAMLVIGIMISDLPRMMVSPEWPTTDGLVVSRRLMAHRIKEYDGDFYTEINTFVRYEYAVDGVHYTSMSINAIDTNYYPYSIGKQYTAGKDVVVDYNPNDPSESVLEPGIVGIFKAFDVYCYLIFGAGIYLIFEGISSIKASGDRRPG